jgi:pimeloyl-ACP methyl ester carboxylesterase
MINSEILDASDELRARVADLVAAHERTAPDFWSAPVGKTVYVPVEHGEIRVIHVKPEAPTGVRPIVLVPGWGSLPAGFNDFYSVLHRRVELYYIETREKRSSRLDRRKARLTMSRKARDIQAALDFLGLSRGRDFVLLGTCWGGALLFQGLLDNSLRAPTLVTLDPMHKLWYPQWVLRYVSPLLPACFFQLIKPVLKKLALAGMKEQVQRRRAEAFIDGAEIWKWKRAAQSVWDFELFGNLHSLQEEVFVFNGTGDKIHDQRNYPRIARELPRGRFFFMPSDESVRERLLGLIALEFAKVRAEAGVPALLAAFEKELMRSDDQLQRNGAKKR